MVPTCRITINGTLVSGVFQKRIISCKVSDKEGMSSDTCSIVLNDWPIAAIPETDEIIRIWMGYGVVGSAFMGSFTVEEVEVEMFPFRMSITGKAAGMNDKKKQNRERHWDKKKVKDIVSQIASENGLAPLIDDEVAGLEYEWIAQQNESDIHFVERLAKRLGAIFSVKDGNLIFAAKGTGKSPSGSALTPIIVTPEILSPGSARVRFTGRTKYKSVKASYTDRAKAQKIDVEEESDNSGKAVYRIGNQFSNEDEAKRAARAKAGDLKRRQATFSCKIIGNPAARAGAPLKFAKCRPGVDGIPFMIGTADHDYSKSGYWTSLSGESQNGGKK